MTIAIYSVVRFRAKPGDMGDGPPIHGNTRLEVIWVTIPFIMVTALAIYGWIVLDDIEAKQQNEMVVNVTGQQFAWTFDYPGQNVNSNELVLPVDRPIDFQIKTKDVLHSFWVPAFRLKSDAVPGPDHDDPADARPDRPLRGGLRRALRPRATPRCASSCACCRRTDFDAWVAAAGSRRARAARRRARAARASGGGGAAAVAVAPRRPRASRSSPPRAAAPATRWRPRTPSGTVGPDLGKLEDTDAAFVRESIVDPSAEVEQGFPDGVMPTDFGDKLSPEELDALVKYLLESQE